MLPKEREYGNSKIARCAALWAAGKEYQLLLEITGLTEDAETLTVKGQPEFVAQSLYFRDHLRAVMESPLYRNYVAGKAPAAEVFKAIEKYALEDMKLKVDLARLAPPRNLLELRNYVDRTKWQYYKSTATRRDFRKFLLFAQYDRRYLRAAARTTRKLEDAPLENHNLPMALLFREALAIKKGNKLAAVGLIDEAVRIPFAWVKALRRSCRSRWPLRISCRGIKRRVPIKAGIGTFLADALNRPRNAGAGPARKRRISEEGGSPHAMTELIRDTMAKSRTASTT